jgi:hypothetical protein
MRALLAGRGGEGGEGLVAQMKDGQGRKLPDAARVPPEHSGRTDGEAAPRVAWNITGAAGPTPPFVPRHDSLGAPVEIGPGSCPGGAVVTAGRPPASDSFCPPNASRRRLTTRAKLV